MNTHNLLLYPVTPTGALAADTAKPDRQPSQKLMPSIRRGLRAAGVAALAALLNVLPVSGQGVLEICPDSAKLLQPPAFSANGTAAVGAAVTNNTLYGVVDPGGLWYWSPSRGFVNLPGGLFTWVDYALSAAGGELHLSGNGQVAVGVRRLPSNTTTNLYELWTWRTDGTMNTSGTVPYHSSLPYADEAHISKVSYDGSTVVGFTLSNSMDGYESIPFRWSKSAGFASLNNNQAAVYGASRDGDVVLCRTVTGSAMIWKANGDVVPVPLDPAMIYSLRLCDSGKAVVGNGQMNLQNFLWRWPVGGSVEYLNLPANYADPSWNLNVTAVSADGRTIAGPLEQVSGPQAYQYWIWTDLGGFQVIPTPNGNTGYYSLGGLSSEGITMWGANAQWAWRWTAADGMHYPLQDFGSAYDFTGSGVGGAVSSDFSVFAGDKIVNSSSNLFWLAAYHPVIETLSTNRATAGLADVPLTIYGVGFQFGSSVFIGGTQLTTMFVSATRLQATIPAAALVSSGDFSTLSITVHGPTGAVSPPVGFSVMGSGVATKVQQVDTAVATAGTLATVAIEPTTETDGGISATLTVTGEEPVTVTVATYTSDPSESGNTSFDVAGQFLDLNVSGVTEADSMRVYFYFPAGTPTETLSLKFWNTRVTPAAWEDVTPVTIDPVLHRTEVVFDANSHPKITELDGTFFAPAVAPAIQFNGFLPPLGGADATGGSFTSPLRTFKAGSTIPLKFTASQSGAPVTTGVHRLQAVKYSDSTTAGTPIDATPQDAATTGNQFRFAEGIWQFNLDTKSTGVTKGVWQLTATLSDGSPHTVWIQIK